MPKRPGRKSAAQTPAPKSERIYGSAKNPEKSASSEKSAKGITLSPKIVKSLQEKLNQFKETHSNKKVSLNDLKAVYRRGLGAYSSSHRPTITGGVPNTRNAWAMARVNKFLKKAAGEQVKKAYVQDDDLLKYEDGGLIAPNGKKSNLTPEQYKLVRTPEFKAWFGDWENKPKKMMTLDENGEPMVFYHTGGDWNELKRGYRDGKLMFTPIKENMYEDRGIKRPFFLKSDYIYKVKYEDRHSNWKFKKGENIRYPLYNVIGANIIIASVPEQIKLADGTNINFDNSPDIRYENGGLFSKENRKMAMNPFDIKGRVNFIKEHPELLKNGGETETKIQLPDVQASEESLKRVLGMQGYDLIKSQKMDKGGQADEEKIYKIQKMQELQQTLADGGTTPQDVICANCSWEWNTADSDESDKYTCHKCGFDNSLFYTVLKETMPLEEIAKKHGVELSYLQEQLAIGMKHEMDEHTKGGTQLSEDIGEIIALHHLEEMPDYYERLDEIEYEFNREKDEDVELVRYSVWYDGEAYDFYHLGDAVDHIEQRNELATIRDYDGKKVMGHEDIESVLNGRKTISDYEKGGDIDEISEQIDEINEYRPEEFLAQQKEEADAILFSRRTQIAKFMICNAYIDMAVQKSNEAESAKESETWDQVADIWRNTKDEVDDVIYMYEAGGVAGGCGCTKFAKGGLAYGNSHAKGGMPMKVKSTGQNIEIEGGEGVINKRSMQMTKRVEFEGKSMTPCEVISKINQMGGGVKFDCSDVKEIVEKDGEF